MNDISSLWRLSNAKSRSISAENFTGEKGRGGMASEGTGAKCARDLGRGWKISPCVKIAAGQTFTIADIAGPGAIQQIWMTPTGHWRHSILRIYWDEQTTPSIECPIGDFFACGWGKFAPLSSLAICVNPGSAFNCYWQMPFRKHCRMTLTNIADAEMTLFYQVNYALCDVPDDAAYFHAQFRRVNPLPYKSVYTILDGVSGRGQYVGTYMAWGVNNTGWWGEGEIKFYLDGDDEFPTICGTGTEDYFCGSYNFENQATKQYQEFTTPYAASAKLFVPMVCIKAKLALACIAGTSPTPSVSNKTCASQFKPLAGAAAADICPCKTTSPALHIGIKRCRPPLFLNCRTRISWK
jgi:hypothetical protein